MTAREFTISEYSLPRHYGVWSNSTDADGYCLENTFEEYARFSSLDRAHEYLNLTQEQYNLNGTLPAKLPNY